MEDKVLKRQIFTPSKLVIETRDNGEGKGKAQKRVITGYAILFNSPTTLWKDEEGEAREVIEKEAVTAAFLRDQDIKMTMFHDMTCVLARSKRGSGTLSYTVDERGVKFEFEVPDTMDGDKAFALVKRGDIDGCSFMFSTRYHDEQYVERKDSIEKDLLIRTYHVKQIIGIYDFTLTPAPAYEETSCEAVKRSLNDVVQPQTDNIDGMWRLQVKEMRENLSHNLII